MVEPTAPTLPKALGALVTTCLVAALLLVMSIPILAGILVGSREPLGRIRESLTPAALLHLLWILPALYIFSSMLEVVERRTLPTRPRAQLALDVVLTWLALLPMLSIFVTGTWGTAIGALVTTALFTVVTALVERHGKKSASASSGS